MAGDCSSADGEKSGEATTHGFLSIKMLFSTTHGFCVGIFQHQCSGYETAKIPGINWFMDSTNKEILWIRYFLNIPKGRTIYIQGIPWGNPIPLKSRIFFRPWKYGDQDLLHHIIWRGWTSSYPGYFGLNRRVPGSESILTHTHINANHSQGIFHFSFQVIIVIVFIVAGQLIWAVLAGVFLG